MTLRNRLAKAARDPALALRIAAGYASKTGHRVWRAPSMVPSWRRERAVRTAGRAAWDEEDFENAHAYFRSAARIGTDPWSWLWLARSSNHRGEFEAGYEAVLRAAELAPGSHQVRRALGRWLGAVGRTGESEALHSFARIRSEIPHADPAHGPRRPMAYADWLCEESARAAGERAWFERDFAAAEERFAAAARYGDSAWTWQWYARALLRRGDGALARDALQRAFVISPASPIVRIDIHTQLGDEGRDIAKELLADGAPRDVVILEALFRAGEGRRAEARALADGIARSASYDELAHAAVLLEIGDALDAWEELEPITDRASTRLLLRLANVLWLQGHISRSYDVVRLAVARHPEGDDAEDAERRETACRTSLKLLRDGFVYESATDLTYRGDPDVVFYLLHNSLPYMSGGYATRTHGLLHALAENREMHGVTRPGFPYDMDAELRVPPVSVIDDVPYHRIGEPRPYRTGNFPKFVDEYVELLEPLARRERVGLVHAASSHWNGIAANMLKRRLGIPSVYEVRGLWEVTRRSREPQYADTDAHALTVKLETQAALEADAVITITNALRHEFIARGVPDEKITIVPNGVNTGRFSVLPRDEALEARFGYVDKRVIGFIGSLVEYEGLDLLLRSVDRLRRERDDFRVLIVGTGKAEAGLWALASELELDDIVTFTGRVPHSEVERYLSVVDVTPFPRRALPVCEMVSPLKPLESMATGKVVVASSVAALAEMVDHGRTGLVFEKESLDDLTRTLAQSLDDDALRTRLAAAAREWVVEERSWEVLARRVEGIYERLLAGVPVDSPAA
jgi:glycosyltransferase involved in cell wall biosynthesis/tetratricopeptide (TPR) repeat protein